MSRWSERSAASRVFSPMVGAGRFLAAGDHLLWDGLSIAPPGLACTDRIRPIFARFREMGIFSVKG